MGRSLIFRDGVLVKTIDGRTLEQAQAETVALLQEELERRIHSALNCPTSQAAAFVQINAMRGGYDAEKCTRINGAVDALRDRYYAMKAEVLKLTTVDDVAHYPIEWS